MKRRVLSILLSVALVLGTCGQASVQGYAAEKNEPQISNSFETGICSEKGEIGDYEYTISYDALTEEVTEMAVADKEDKKLTLRVEDDKSCTAMFNAGDDNVYCASFMPEEYDTDTTLTFRMDEELLEDNAEINDMFDEALEIWEQALAKEMDTNLVAVGFTTEFVVGINEAIAEATEEQSTEVESTVEETSSEELTSEEITTEEITSEEESIVETEDEMSEAVTDETEVVTEDETVTETEVVTEDETVTETEMVTEDETTDESMENLLGEPLNPSAQRIVLNQTAITLYGPVVKDMVKRDYDTFQLKASVFPENWSPEDVSENIVWSSDDESVATVGSANGLVRAEATGTATITATITEDAKTVSASCVVTVLDCDVTEEEMGEEIFSGIWMSGFNEGTAPGKEILYTGGKITQNLRIFDHKKLLVEGRDYTLTYKNNVNVRSVDKLNSPSVTIKMKGQYVGAKVLYFAISPRDLSDTVNTTPGAVMTSAAKLQKFNPAVTYGAKRLVKGTDYTIQYYKDYNDDEDNTPADNNTANYFHTNKQSWPVTYKLTGKGNYTGSMMGTYTIVPKTENVANAAIKYTKSVAYSGTPITVDDLNIKLKLPGASTYSDISSTSEIWDVTISNDRTPGKSAFTITPKVAYADTYAGKLSKGFTIAAAYNLKNVAEVAPGWLDEVKYNKSASETIDPITGKKMGMRQSLGDDELLVAKTGEVAISAEDYTVIYSANAKVGTAKVTFRGKGKCKGSFVKTFKITAGGELTVDPIADVTYVLGGVSPAVTVADEDGTELKKNVDYTVTYVDNKKVGIAKAIIKGKGSYASAEQKEVSYNIQQASISEFKVFVPDKASSAKANKYMSKPVVYDVNGKKLVEGRDYSQLTLDDYMYADKDTTDTPAAQTVINVVINGINNYKDSTTGCYRIYDKSKDIANLLIAVDPQIYTGQAVEPVPVVNPDDAEDKGAIHVYLTSRDKKQKKQAPAADYVEIVSYTNNIKVGTAKVTLKGIGEYGGTRTVAFKINKKALISNRVQKVVMDTSSLPKKFYPGAETTLSAHVYPTDADNDRIIWTTSNSKIIRIDSVEVNDVDGVNVSTVHITSVGEGVATITATAQDNRKAKAISISTKTKPVTSITISETKLELASGATHKLTYTAAPADAFMDKIGWFSTNTTVATVDSTGNVTANHAGSAYIVVKDFNKSSSKDKNTGVTACCFITVTESKSEMINVVSYGLVAGNNSKGDVNVRAFDNAFSQAKLTGKSVYVPAGTYYITARQSADRNGVIIDEKCTNISLVMDSGAKLVGVDCSDKDSRVMWLNYTNNISITGGTIIGGKSGSGGVCGDAHGIRMNSSSNVVISNVTIKDCYGDGIYIGSRGSEKACSGIDIINCKLSGSKRHNFSLVNSQYVRIEGCSISNPAHLLIDIEANDGCSNKHIKILNNTINTSGNGAIVAILNSADDIEINRNVISGGTDCYIENRSGTRVTYNGVTIGPGSNYDV